MRQVILALLLTTSLATLQSQNNNILPEDLAFIEEMEDTLGLLAYTVLNDSLEENRYIACRAMIPKLVQALKRPNSFQYPFKQLQYLSFQYPPDSSFRIITWQLFVSRDEYRYYGAIQMNGPELKLFPLIDRSFEISDGELEQTNYTNDDWYGYVVYDIKEVKSKDTKYYLLFGADTYEAFRRRKMIDVLSFDTQSGNPSFGLPVFLEEEAETGRLIRTRNRLVQEYSAASYATLKYDEKLGMIMQENLITVDGPHGEGPVNVPDGSYIGYKLGDDGRWHNVSKVYHHTYQKAPRTETLKEDRVDRDLLGRRRND